MVDPQEYFLGSTDPNSERIAQIFGLYQTELAKNNAMDFDDLLAWRQVRVLKSFARRCARRYQRRYRYLLVDESQDEHQPAPIRADGNCSLEEHEKPFARWVSRRPEHLLVAALTSATFLNLSRTQCAHPFRLEQNYRSAQVILEAAGAVVANNLKRKGKKLWTERQGGSLIGYYEAPDGENEALFIADKIQAFQRESHDGNEASGGTLLFTAVLYRTNSGRAGFEEALRRYNIKISPVVGQVQLLRAMPLRWGHHPYPRGWCGIRMIPWHSLARWLTLRCAVLANRRRNN